MNTHCCLSEKNIDECVFKRVEKGVKRKTTPYTKYVSLSTISILPVDQNSHCQREQVDHVHSVVPVRVARSLLAPTRVQTLTHTHTGLARDTATLVHGS